MSPLTAYVAGSIVGGFTAWGLATARHQNQQARAARWDSVREARWLETGRREGRVQGREECDAEAYLVGLNEGVQMERDRMRSEHPSSGEPET